MGFSTIDYLLCPYRSGVGSLGPSYSRRLYVHDGMVPKYTGYVPSESSSMFISIHAYALMFINNIMYNMHAISLTVIFKLFSIE